jgi:ribosome silencing factor RsfS/YbeB/iojap
MAVKRAKKSSRSASKPSTKSKSTKAKASVAKPARGTSAPAKKSARKPLSKPVAPAKKAGINDIVKVVEGALDDMKAVNVKVIDVHKLTDIADTMVIASGNSDRHVRSIADRVVEFAKKAGFRPMGVEGERDGEWVLVDLQDVIVHIMLPRVREFYRLENLWDVSAARREAAVTNAE